MTNTVDRRHFLAGLSLTGLALSSPTALAQMRPEDKFDLVVKGGEVLDPGAGLRSKRDIGVYRGLIAAVEGDIPGERANRLLDASGKLVTPGLIDLHAHVYPYGSAIGIPADEVVPQTCITTAVSAGDAGANNISAFRRHIAAQTRTRLYAFVHIANFGLSGFPVGEMLNIDHAQVDAAAKAIAENRDMVLGAKVRTSRPVVGQNGLEPLRRAIQACERSGVPNARVMCHIGDTADIAQTLDLLRPGDILTHCFSGAGNNIVQDGKLLPAALEAKRRGVIFDVGHGGGSFDYTVAEAAIQQGAPPDVISSDLHVASGNSPGLPFLPWVMSKFLGLGFTLEQVVAMATKRPGEIIGRQANLGVLTLGAPADLAILDFVQGPVDFVDTRNNRRQGQAHLRPVQTVRGGVPYGRPFMAPFSPT